MQLRVKFTCFYEEEVRISLISEDNLFSVIKNKEINLFCGRQFNFHLVSYVKTFHLHYKVEKYLPTQLPNTAYLNIWDDRTMTEDEALSIAFICNN